MRIAHVIDSLGLGGAQTVVKGIFESQKTNSNIFIFALRQRDITIQIDHPNVIIFPSVEKYSIASLLSLKRFISQNRIDVLHCHLFKSQVFGWLLKIFSFRKITLIFHEHGGIVEDGVAYKILMKISKRSVNVFIACSNAMKRYLVRSGGVPDKKVKVLFNFVNLGKFKRETIDWDIVEEKRKLNIKPNDFVFGFAGRLIERKGWREFLEAARLFLIKHKNAKFLIAGDGADKSALNELIGQLDDKENIVFIGYVSNMVWFYSMLDCFVMPSHWEGLPMAQLEVLAMGIPLVSTNGPGMDEIAIDGESCLYAQVRDAESIFKAMKTIHENDGLRRSLSMNALKTANDHGLVDFLKKLDVIYSSAD